ncbi:MAG: hypothetical protein K6E76_02895 [Patescibacteria group bacterium]|nr:hypothetical protein [Patescibacteria group bacterium]
MLSLDLGEDNQKIQNYLLQEWYVRYPLRVIHFVKDQDVAVDKKRVFQVQR